MHITVKDEFHNFFRETTDPWMRVATLVVCHLNYDVVDCPDMKQTMQPLTSDLYVFDI